MSTCPRCKGHLTDSHRCPRSRAAAFTEMAAAGVAGGLAGWVLVAYLDPGGDLTHVDTWAIALGALAGAGIDRLLRR